MPNSSSRTCSSCGARLPDGADVCDLCGRPVSYDPEDTANASDNPSDAETPDEPAAGSNGAPEPAPAPQTDGGPYCHSCGHQNPVDARFCSQCGTRLETEEAPPPGAVPVEADLPHGSSAEEEEEPLIASMDTSENVGRQVTFVVGGVLVLVVGLFVLTTWSQETWSGSSGGASQPSPDAAASAAGAMSGSASASATSASSLKELVTQASSGESLPPQMAAQVDSLEAAIANQSGAQMQDTRRELINAYVGAGHLGSAALVQKQMAEAAGTPEAWRRTGDLLYSWMETLKGQPVAVQVAEHVVQAYQRVLEQQPDNLDVRTDMATAYLQTNSPMRGVKEINRVLDEDPDHFQARFNKGIMLVMIGRTDQAIAQFEKVKGIVGEESPYYQQAEQAIQTIREREAAAASDSINTP